MAWLDSAIHLPHPRKDLDLPGASPGVRANRHSARRALISPETRGVARASCPGGLEPPETAYFCANTECRQRRKCPSRTPLTFPEISATSLFGGETLAYVLLIESRTSAAACTSTLDVGEVAATAKIQFHQPRFISSNCPALPPQWISGWPVDGCWAGASPFRPVGQALPRGRP